MPVRKPMLFTSQLAALGVRLIFGFTEIHHQDVYADQQHPQREYQRSPIKETQTQQEKQGQRQAQEGHPARENPGAQREGAGGDHEHPCHLHGIDVHNLIGYYTTERVYARSDQQARGSAVDADDASGYPPQR